MFTYHYIMTHILCTVVTTYQGWCNRFTVDISWPSLKKSSEVNVIKLHTGQKKNVAREKGMFCHKGHCL